MKNFGNLLKEAQKMQGQMAKVQAELGAMVVTGQAGGGMVEVKINGRNQVERVRIEPSVVNPEEVEMLEDLIAAAFHDAMRQIQEETQKRLSSVTGGMKLPGLDLGM
ncbi:MAG: YbaB/EbfC family nucleoid-associated protein [Magnetococcales bacterium]|nr:YbaB/EbfC family nucleoid-associated protein [Magnetococcales bacterium]